MSFHVGQQVECVRDDPGGECIWDDGEAPVKGRIYTITRAYKFEGKPTVRLTEIDRTSRSRAIHGPEIGYWAFRFRPVNF